MATELKLPQLGENVDSGTLSRLLVTVGATVKKDDPVLELETDKATGEVPSFSDGVVKEILVKEGDRIKVGQTILTLEAGNGAAAAPAKAEPQAEEKKEVAPQEAPAKEAAAPATAPAAEKEAAQPQQAQQPEPKAGQEELEHERRIGERALAQYAGSLPAGGSGAPRTTPPPAPSAPAAKQAPVPAAPSVRRLARELGVNIYEVIGTGPGGRISDDDVKGHAKSLLTGMQTAAPAAVTGGGFPGLAFFEAGIGRRRLSG